MSHEDAVVKLPRNFSTIAYSKVSFAIIEKFKKKFMGSISSRGYHILIMENKFL